MKDKGQGKEYTDLMMLVGRYQDKDIEEEMKMLRKGYQEAITEGKEQEAGDEG